MQSRKLAGICNQRKLLKSNEVLEDGLRLINQPLYSRTLLIIGLRNDNEAVSTRLGIFQSSRPTVVET